MQWIKHLVKSTPFEKPARWLYGKANPASGDEWTLRVKRDEKRLGRVLPALVQRQFHCIDIGAHRGAFLDKFLQLAPNGNHLAFEPLPEMFKELQSKYQGVTIFPVALSNTKEEATFYKINNAKAWSGLKMQSYPKNVQVEEIEVQVDRLDNVIPEFYIPDFIKIDVEGAELQVLQGGRSTISKHRPIVLFEHAAIHNEQYGTTPQQVFRFFKECRMQLCRLDLQHSFSEKEFVDLYFQSRSSNYDRNAETNFIARAAS